MGFPGEEGVSFTAYSAEPASPSADNLALLASWAATNVAHTQHHGLTEGRDSTAR